MHHRVLKCLISLGLLIIVGGCSSEDRKLAGIWHTEFETVPNLTSALDFELRHDWAAGKWSGRFELAELMATADLAGVSVAGSEIGLDLGGGAKFKGHFSAEEMAIKGVLDVPGQKPETLRFTKIARWSSQVPARTDKNGQWVKAWKYQPPSPVGDGWKVGRMPGAELQALQGLFQQILQGKYHGLDALLIARNGQLVLEEYFYLGSRDRIHSIQSATKSVNSLLMGIARDHGLISDLDVPLKSYFPQYPDPAGNGSAAPSVRHALTMSAALDWKEDIPYTDPANDAVRMNASKDLYQYVLSKNPDPKDKPGEKFEYNSGLSILLGGVLQRATGKPADEYAKQTLFNSLGIKKFSWTSMGGKVHTGGGLFLRPRDLLKIGQLVLDDGKWNGEQVVSEAWIKESTAFALPLNESNKDFGYGYQWWRGVFRSGHTVFPVIYAAGYGGQMLYIVPDLNLVVLTFHHNQSDTNGTHSITWKEMQTVIIPALR